MCSTCVQGYRSSIVLQCVLDSWRNIGVLHGLIRSTGVHVYSSSTGVQRYINSTLEKLVQVSTVVQVYRSSIAVLQEYRGT
jgi:hypothetical protein